ncbi:hypothetical protein L345_17463, partial [Ophiophagus hannah]
MPASSRQGARVCLGENLARIKSFLLLTNLLRSFKFQLPEGVKELNQEPRHSTCFAIHKDLAEPFHPSSVGAKNTTQT